MDNVVMETSVGMQESKQNSKDTQLNQEQALHSKSLCSCLQELKDHLSPVETLCYRLPLKSLSALSLIEKEQLTFGSLQKQACLGKALILGGAFVDVTLLLDHIPPVGGDSYAQELNVGVGGCAINVANIVRDLGIDHKIKVPLGNGPYAKLSHDQLLQDGYGESDFIMVPQSPYDCAYCLCMIDKDGERTFVAVPGIENHMQKEWLSDLAIEDYDLIYFVGFDLTDDNGLVYLNEIKERKKDNAVIFFDAGARVNFIKPEAFELLLSLNPIIHLNRMELELITKTNNIKAGLEHLSTLTTAPVILSLDIDGAVVSYQGHYYHFPVVPQKVIDATGAGDSQSAGIIAALLKGATLEQAMYLGNTLASYCIKQVSARLSLPSDFSY